ncbi:MAG: transporter substrate-binding domain-containing protein [Marinobacter sp.]|nr:transporter substrate-binding domain-containing protein [Marinobacter sp.]
MRDIRLSGTYGIVKKSRIPLVALVVAVMLLGGGTRLLADEPVTAHEENPPTVVLGIGEHWEPYYSETLPNGGVAVEIVRKAFERSGYALELHWLPWARAFNMAKKGRYDGVLGAWYTEERTQFFTYTHPFLTTELVFFKKKGKRITYTTLQDLKPYTIGVARDSGPYELLKPEFGQNLEVATSAELNIQN